MFVYWKTMNKIKQKLFFLLTVHTRHHRGGAGGGGGGGRSLRTIVKRSEEREESEDLPEIMTPSQVIRREVGGTAILACSVENLGQYVVMWKQDGRVISGQISLLLLLLWQQLIISHFSREFAGEERRPDQTVRHWHRVQPLPVCSDSGGKERERERLERLDWLHYIVRTPVSTPVKWTSWPDQSASLTDWRSWWLPGSSVKTARWPWGRERVTPSDVRPRASQTPGWAGAGGRARPAGPPSPACRSTWRGWTEPRRESTSAPRPMVSGSQQWPAWVSVCYVSRAGSVLGPHLTSPRSHYRLSGDQDRPAVQPQQPRAPDYCQDWLHCPQ